jgi:CheY-like chemotaxis protein
MTDFATEESAIEQLGFRVLVVEDSRDTLDMIELWLTTFGCEVQVAASAPAALKLAAEDPPDLIISDIGLPDLDGYQLIRKVRQMPGLRSIPAIALTGFARPEDRELALAAGYDAHLSKPAEMRRLIRLMKRLMNTNSSNADQTLRTTDSSSSSSRS